MTRISRYRRRTSPLVVLLVGGLIVVAVALVVLLVLLLTRDDPEPMVDSDTAVDEQRTFEFDLPDGWTAVYDGNAIRVESETDLPAFWVEERSGEEIGLVANWNCPRLVNYVDTVVGLVAPWPLAVVYRDVPCAQDENKPVYGRAYGTLDDGRTALIVFGPLDGVTWVVARSAPFTGEVPAQLADAVTFAVTTARRRL
jgi:hypothetical protein